MKIALVTEGTYPFHQGGVSVWCHQLIEGLSEHEFEVLAISGTGTETAVWPNPANLRQVRNVPLWGHAPPTRRAGRSRTGSFESMHERFVGALVLPEEASSRSDFLASIRAMYEYAQTASLSHALLSNESLARLSNAWMAVRRGRGRHTGRREMPITFADVLTATDLIEHFLRPLSTPMPPADVYHAASNGLAALVGMTGAWTHGVPFLLTEHGIYLRERYLSYLNGPGTHVVKTLVLNFFRLLSGAAYASADLIRPGSDYNHRWEVQNGADPDRISTVYNGIDVAEFPVAKSEPSVPTISWLGRIDPIKDLHTLIRAFGSVVETLPTAELRLFGSAPAGNEAYLASCYALVHELGLVESVRFEGRVDHPVDAYRAGSIVALTSISEGFPYSLIEAMATGRATVATDVGGVREAIGQAGVVVPPGDARTLAAACLMLLQNRSMRKSIGRDARQRVLRSFTLDMTLTAYRRCYRELRSARYGGDIVSVRLRTDGRAA